MNITALTAHADQLHAQVRDARDCDALTPCETCVGLTVEVRAARHAARVAAMSVRSSFSMLRDRLASVR